MNADLSFERWFQADELEVCPDCGDRQLIPPSPAALMRLCLGCGVVPKPGLATGETVATA
jgi:hypothetical protein